MSRTFNLGVEDRDRLLFKWETWAKKTPRAKLDGDEERGRLEFEYDALSFSVMITATYEFSDENNAFLSLNRDLTKEQLEDIIRLWGEADNVRVL